jgi:hypothetical protein
LKIGALACIFSDTFWFSPVEVRYTTLKPYQAKGLEYEIGNKRYVLEQIDYNETPP